MASRRPLGSCRQLAKHLHSAQNPRKRRRKGACFCNRLVSTVKKKTGTFKLYSPGMEQRDTTRRSVLFGLLTVTLPALSFVPLSVFFGLYVFGPFWWPYYVTGGLALGWQWYAAAMPRWTESLIKKGFQQGQAQLI